MIVIVSDLDDTNINHFFQLEVHAVWRTINSFPIDDRNKMAVFLVRHDSSIVDSMWRVGVLSSIVPRGVFFSLDDVKNAGEDVEAIVKLAPWTWLMEGENPCVDSVGPWSRPMVSAFHFSRMAPPLDSLFLFNALAETVIDKVVGHVNNSREEWTILIVTRDNSRVMIDSDTLERVEFVLPKLLPESLRKRVQVTSFKGLEFAEQVKIVSRARIMIGVHGAALTNLAWMRPGGRVYEISLRKHWYCSLDKACGHLAGTVAYEFDCGAGLSPPFTWYHKADYHNLAIAFGKTYIEVQNCGGGPHMNDNPINVETVKVDCKDLAVRIQTDTSAVDIKTSVHIEKSDRPS